MSIKHFFTILAKKATFFKHQKFVVSAYNILHNFFYSRLVLFLINLVYLLLIWLFYKLSKNIIAYAFLFCLEYLIFIPTIFSQF